MARPPQSKVAPGIYEKDHGFWLRYSYDGKQIRVRLGTNDPSEAIKRANELRGRPPVDRKTGRVPGWAFRTARHTIGTAGRHAFERSEPVLRCFGGNLTYLGEEAGAAPTIDLATLSYVYGTMLGFLQGARVCEVEGIRVDTFGSIIAAVAPGFSEFLRHEGTVTQSGDFRISESPLSISVEATERIAQAARAAGINAELPDLAASLFRRAAAAGYAREEAAALIKVLREPVGTSAPRAADGEAIA